MPNTNLSPYPEKSTLVNRDLTVNPDWVRWFAQIRNYLNRVLNKYNGSLGGVATLVAGTIVIANTSVTANSKIQMTAQNNSGTPGHLYVTLNPGVGFTITSTSATDTRTIFYEIKEAF